MYNPYHFNFSTRSWYVSDLVKHLPALPLTWDTTTSSRFIESLLIRMPTDKLWVDRVGNGYELIDGRGRVAVLQSYLNDVFHLEGLEYLVDLRGLRFNQLQRNWQRRLEETPIEVVIIDSGTPTAIRESLVARVRTRPGVPPNPPSPMPVLPAPC
jgi:hypothetical protein